MTDTGAALERVLAALTAHNAVAPRRSGDGWMANCPAHQDHTPSLRITQGTRTPGVILNCHGRKGCTPQGIKDALGLSWADLFDEEPTSNQPVIVDTYRYTDAHGAVLYEKLRLHPKTFRVRRDVAGRWVWTLGEDTPRALFRLPKVLAAIKAGTEVWVVEGEADVLRLEREGLCATCNPEGASEPGKKPKWRPEYTDTLKGARVVVVADNDGPGVCHARAIGLALVGKAESIRLVRPALDVLKADVSDHLNAGLPLADLVPLTTDYVPGEPGDTDDAAAVEAARERFDREVAFEAHKIRVRDAAKQQVQDERGAALGINVDRLVTGGAFVHDAPDLVPAVWGRGSEVLWAVGEPLLIVGATGVGKTTLVGQIVAGLLGLVPTVLGFEVAPRKRVLYLAMDRPAQIARALGRLLRQFPRDRLDEGLVVWRGPPPQDLAARPEALLELALKAGADTVVIDSLKDAAVGLSDERVGQGISRAMNLCVESGVEVVVCHHQVKGSNGVDDHKPTSIDGVYGSAFVTAGVGSLLMLVGKAGDPLVILTHLKTPAKEVGPLQITVDHDRGVMSVIEGTDVLGLLLAWPRTAREAAMVMWETEHPSRAEVEKARRKIMDLVGKGLAVRLADPSSGGATDGSKGGGEGARYGAATNRIGPRSLHEDLETVHAADVSAGQARCTPVDREQDPDDLQYRSTKSVHVGPRNLGESGVSAGESVHADRSTSVHAPSGPCNQAETLIHSSLSGVDQGGGTPGDLEKGPSTKTGDDHWVLAHLTPQPQHLDQLSVDLDTDPTDVAAALTRLAHTGTATRTATGWTLTPQKQATT